MLEKLVLKNVALIPYVEIEFSHGFNVLTGETGAGKSIVLGGFDFILGEKLDKNIVRTGEQSCRVDAVFRLSDDEVKIFSRVLKADGRSEYFIDGEVATQKQMKEQSSEFVNVHGQHDTAMLLDRKNYIRIIDEFGRIDTAEFLVKLQKLAELEAELEKNFKSSEQERQRTIDLLNFQICEIEDFDPKPGEDETLQKAKEQMQNFEKIKNAMHAACGYDAGDSVGHMSAALANVEKFDDEIADFLVRGRDIQYELDSLTSDIAGYAEKLEYDAEEFTRIDARLDSLRNLRRKYGANVEEILATLSNLKAEHAKLVNSEQIVLELKNRIETSRSLADAAAAELTKARKIAASELSRAMILELGQLGMEKAELVIEITPCKLSKNGADQIEFLFTANAGEPPKPLGTTMSGGELSRFMLSLKSLGADFGGATLVFDEIDTGIGGVTAKNVAEKISRIAKKSQVIVVTHLVQIAKLAAAHFLISKSECDGKTITSVSKLCDEKSRQQELDRMLGL